MAHVKTTYIPDNRLSLNEWFKFIYKQTKPVKKARKIKTKN